MKSITLTTTALMTTLPLLAGCGMNMKRLAYEVLAQEDCRRNQLEDFCSRGFVHEYEAYERTRQEFMRSQQESNWRARIQDNMIRER